MAPGTRPSASGTSAAALSGDDPLVEILDSLGHHITTLAMHPDGTRMAGGSRFRDIVLWDLEQLDTIASFTAHDDLISSLDFDGAGNRLASVSRDGTLRIRDAVTLTARDEERSAARPLRTEATTLVEQMIEEHGDVHAAGAQLARDPHAHGPLRPWLRHALLRVVEGERMDALRKARARQMAERARRAAEREKEEEKAAKEKEQE